MKIILKRTKGVHTFLGLQATDKTLVTFFEYLFSDTGSKKRFNFAFSTCYRDQALAPETITMDVEFPDSNVRHIIVNEDLKEGESLWTDALESINVTIAEECLKQLSTYQEYHVVFAVTEQCYS